MDYTYIPRFRCLMFLLTVSGLNSRHRRHHHKYLPFVFCNLDISHNRTADACGSYDSTIYWTSSLQAINNNPINLHHTNHCYVWSNVSCDMLIKHTENV